MTSCINSIGSLTTTAEEFATPLNSGMETKQLKCASVEPVSDLQTTQKRSAAELEENDFPPAKKILSPVVMEGSLEANCKVRL